MLALNSHETGNKKLFFTPLENVSVLLFEGEARKKLPMNLTALPSMKFHLRNIQFIPFISIFAAQMAVEIQAIPGRVVP